MSWSELLTVGIAAIAAIVTYINFKAFIKYSDIAVYSSFQKLVLEKSKDCNQLWERIPFEEHYNNWGTDNSYSTTISEIVISIQLIDETLAAIVPKSTSQKRLHFIKLFWIQLSPEIRQYIKEDDLNKHSGVFKEQMRSIQITFQHLFEAY